jgi:hypothetical protein
LEGLVSNYRSVEALCKDINKIKSFEEREHFIWMGQSVLWERWFPNHPNFAMLDDKIQEGYKFFSDRDYNSMLIRNLTFLGSNKLRINK